MLNIANGGLDIVEGDPFRAVPAYCCVAVALTEERARECVLLLRVVGKQPRVAHMPDGYRIYTKRIR